jgi:hypothetical protein
MTDRLVVVGEYIDYEEATLVAGALRAEGIRVVLPHDPRPTVGRPSNPGRLVLPDMHRNSQGYLIQVLVEPQDADEAADLIDALTRSLSSAFDNAEVDAWHDGIEAQERRDRERLRTRGLMWFYGLAGLFFAVSVLAYVLTRGPGSDPRASVGVWLNEAGDPELVTVQCSGYTIGDATIHDAEDATVVWRAEREPDRGGWSLPLVGLVHGYRITPPGWRVSADGRYRLGEVHDNTGRALVPGHIEFSRADLRRDQVLVGRGDPDAPPRYVANDTFFVRFTDR